MTTQTNKSKEKDPRFRVVPGLTIRSDELKARIKNRSIRINPNSGRYSLDENIDGLRRMNRTDVIHQAQKNANVINSLKTKLENAPKSTGAPGKSTKGNPEG